MKANEVLKLLQITRPTLCKYVKEGWIKTEKLKNKVPASEMPKTLYIFSDMEFNGCMSFGRPSRERWSYGNRITGGIGEINTLLENIARKWMAYGYELQKVRKFSPKNYKTH